MRRHLFGALGTIRFIRGREWCADRPPSSRRKVAKTRPGPTMCVGLAGVVGPDGLRCGSQPGVFAESPNRIFVAARGELKLPEPLPPGFNGTWGSLGQGFATSPRPELRNTIVVLDSSGRQIERDIWGQWDTLFKGGPQNAGGPHKIRISPYDPERHVWVIDEIRHVIYKFSHDGQRLVKTLGEADKAARRPKSLWPATRRGVSARRLDAGRGWARERPDREVRSHETFVRQWGSKGAGPDQLDRMHGIDADKYGRVYVADRGNPRMQVFDQNGKHLDTWPGLRFPNHIVVAPTATSGSPTARMPESSSTTATAGCWTTGVPMAPIPARLSNSISSRSTTPAISTRPMHSSAACRSLPRTRALTPLT